MATGRCKRLAEIPPDRQRGARALRSGVLEICMNPENGCPSSTIRKIAPEADRAQMNKTPAATGLRRENRPKLAKITESQKIKTARKGVGIELPPCSSNNRRVCARPTLSSTARLLSKR